MNAVDFDRLVFSDVSRHFGRRRVLSRVSFSCAAGEIVGLLGPNGAGKSTLVAIAATLLRPTSGTVRYGSHAAADAGAPLRGRIGLLGHELHLYTELTARENLTFFAQLYRIDRTRERVNAALERAGLADRADDIVSTFSRGMRQRLALERALLHEPRLVLLDEPFTGLDERATTALLDRLVTLRGESRIVLLATHDIETVERAVDRAAVLRDGKLVALDRTRGTLRDGYRAALQQAVETQPA